MSEPHQAPISHRESAAEPADGAGMPCEARNEPQAAQRPLQRAGGHFLAPAALAEMEQWLAHLHQGTNVAPLDWFASLLASHAALTARLAEAHRRIAHLELAKAAARLDGRNG